VGLYTCIQFVYKYTIGVVRVSEDREMLSARVPAELKQLVNADERNNQEVLEAALWREFGGERVTSLERRLEEKESRRSLLERERNERDREIGELESEISALENRLDNLEESKTKELEEALRGVKKVPDDPETGYVQEVAEKYDMDPEEVLKESKKL